VVSVVSPDRQPEVVRGNLPAKLLRQVVILWMIRVRDRRMVWHSTKLLVDTPVYMRIRVSLQQEKRGSPPWYSSGAPRSSIEKGYPADFQAQFPPVAKESGYPGLRPISANLFGMFFFKTPTKSSS
jgi:hypothetical protein